MSEALPLSKLLKAYGIALTGGIGTGKSTVARLLQAAGVPVIDADQLARAIVAPGTPGLAAVTAAFGAQVLTPAGALDRPRLGALVFRDPAQRRQLEAITHPLIRAALASRLAELGLTTAPRPFIYEASLIYETATAGDFRAVWVTWCPRDVQLARVMARDGSDRARAEAVVASQMDARAKADLADVTLRTDVPLATTQAEVMELVRGPLSVL